MVPWQQSEPTLVYAAGLTDALDLLGSARAHILAVEPFHRFARASGVLINRL